MRIAMIGQKGVPAIAGGVERHVEEIGKRLVQQGHEVTVYCRSTYGGSCRPATSDGMRLRYIYTLDNKNLEAILYAFQASVDALPRRFDIIHYHALGPTSLSFIPRLFGKNVIATVHGLDWQRDKWGRLAKAYLKLGERATARFPARIIAVSPSLRDYFVQNYGKDPGDVVFIPNGVNVKPRVEPKEITKLGLDEKSYILFLARIVPEKGAHYLIEAYNRLHTDKKLVIAGGESHTERYFQRLRSMAGDNPNVVFTGNVQGRMLEELYSNAYVYVLPSDVEGMPITLLEAMSYARCCLTSDIPENQAVVKNQFGRCFEKGNIASLTDELARMLQESAAVDSIGETAFNEIVQNYDWDKIAKATESVYLSILSA
ncbi:MAG: glycosyltransferase family 4 protein [Bacteroidota bacterium]